MPRMVDLGVTTYWWVDAASITDPTTIDAAVLTAADNISEYVVATTSVGATASDTVSERGITDVANVETPTVGNYQGTLVLFRDYDAGVPSADDPLTTIGSAAGVRGWVVRRVGKPATDAAAASDHVEAYLFSTDNPQLTGGQSDGYLKATIPLLQQGKFSVDTVLTGV